MTTRETPETTATPALGKQLDQILQEAGVQPRFGLIQQGHFDTVSSMREAGKHWNEIGTAIGWAGHAVQQMYEIESRSELARLTEAQAQAQADTARMDWLEQQAQADDGGGFAFRRIGLYGWMLYTSTMVNAKPTVREAIDDAKEEE